MNSQKPDSTTARIKLLAIASALLISAPHIAGQSAPPAQPRGAIADDGTVHTPALDVPYSVFASEEARQAFIASAQAAKAPSSPDIAVTRRFYDEWGEKAIAKLKTLYPVKVEITQMGGVPVRIITPLRPDPRNRRRVLLCVHGGSFMWGGGSGVEIEAIPIAAGGFRVVSVDYRLAPEHRFPDAVEDITAVYKALLQQYPAKNIGIYGGSAGAVLSGETIAALEAAHLPVPGAVGLFNGGVTEMTGDSVYWAMPFTGQPPINQAALRSLKDIPYFSAVDMKDPLVLPGSSREVLQHFPPTLLLSGTRDFALSSVLYSERLLTQAGVRTELHVWDGLWHASFGNPALPESQEMYRLVASFFEEHLGS